MWAGPNCFWCALRQAQDEGIRKSRTSGDGAVLRRRHSRFWPCASRVIVEPFPCLYVALAALPYKMGGGGWFSLVGLLKCFRPYRDWVLEGMLIGLCPHLAS